MTADVLLSRRDDAKSFAVVCRRFDGRDREYQRYESAELAELVARRLREIGLEARVEERVLTINADLGVR